MGKRLQSLKKYYIFIFLSNLQKEGKSSSELHMQDRVFYWQLRGQLMIDLVYENCEGCYGERRADMVREAAFKKEKVFPFTIIKSIASKE